MVFKLLNLYNSSPLKITISYQGVTLEFDISTIVNKRTKEELDDNLQFKILMAYLDHKGSKFKDKLMEEYIKAEELIYNGFGKVEIIPIPYALTEGILDMFDLVDVYIFIRDVYRLPPLSSLDDEFNTKMITDSRGTRVQTYIKTDYLQLAALVQILKAVVGPIGQFGYFNKGELGKVHNHYTLFNFITNHHISESEPFVKLRGLITKVVETVSKDTEETSIRIIEKQLPSGELVDWVMSIAIMQKVAMAVILDDTNEKNVITKTYTFVNNKLNIKADTSNAIRSDRKNQQMSEDAEPKSVLETFNPVTEIPKGILVELEWSVDVIVNNVKNFFNVDEKELAIAKDFTRKLEEHSLSKTQIILCGWIFQNHIDPRSLIYVKLDKITALLALAFVLLWQNDFKYLALLITTFQSEDDDDSIIINFTSNRSRITKELKLELDELFPYKKLVVNTANSDNNRVINVAEASINLIADEIYKQRLIYTANTDYILEVTGNKSISAIIPANLKLMLAELVIKINKGEMI